MKIESIVRKEPDRWGRIRVEEWKDQRGTYHLTRKIPGFPDFNSTAINGLPALHFQLSYLVCDVKYSKRPNSPFTWIMAVKPGHFRREGNIFTTSDLQEIHDAKKEHTATPIYARTDGIDGPFTNDTKLEFHGHNLPLQELTIYTIWYDGNNAKIFWGKNLKVHSEVVIDRAGEAGFIVMGRGVLINDFTNMILFNLDKAAKLSFYSTS